jgi:hypothetical protein
LRQEGCAHRPAAPRYRLEAYTTVALIGSNRTGVFWEASFDAGALRANRAGLLEAQVD